MGSITHEVYKGLFLISFCIQKIVTIPLIQRKKEKIKLFESPFNVLIK